MNLSVLCWNVSWKEPADSVVGALKKIDADVLILQEITKDSTANPDISIPDRIAAHGYDYTYKDFINRGGEKHKVEGLGIFSKFKIKDSRVTYINKGDDKALDSSNYDRIYLEADIDTPSGGLKIGNAQLSYSDYFEITKARKKESDALIEAVKDNNRRFIFAGDLNAVSDSAVVKKLLGLFKQADPPFSEPTFPTMQFDYHNFSSEPYKYRIDYLLATEDMETVSSSILRPGVSDHLPILSMFKLPG